MAIASLDEAKAKNVLRQVEFYFSDSNLPRDKFLKKSVEESEDGLVSLALICTFARMRGHLGMGEMKAEEVPEETVLAVAETLRKSPLLKISDDGKRVGRSTELSKPDEVLEQVDSRTVAAYPLPYDVKIEDVESFFGQHGKVNSVRLPRVVGDKKHFFGTALIEFSEEEDAKKALSGSLVYAGAELELKPKKDFDAEREVKRKEFEKTHSNKDASNGGDSVGSSLKMEKISALDMPDVPMGQLPEHLEIQRTRVVCKSDAPIHTEGVHYSGAYAAMGVDNSLQLDSFCANFKVVVNRQTEDDIEFDMIGIDAALANAFRRILIAEVPSMAIEQVLVANNTSVIADEIIAHRLGLIPLKADPRLFEYLSENDVPNERNTIVFKLEVSCQKAGPRLTVKSDQLKWLPNGSELLRTSRNPATKPKTYTSFSCSQSSLPEYSKNPPSVKHPDITIARLGPGQAIELEAHAVKGIGKTHAKWSPVATAWYRMLPEVVFLKEIKNKDAEELVARCPVGVFDIEDNGHGEKRAVVANPRACTLCRECIRGGNEDAVELRRVKDHFIFTVESAGGLPPEVLFTEAVKILEEKCDRVISELS